MSGLMVLGIVNYALFGDKDMGKAMSKQKE
jgi:hypothetical protein